MPGARDTAQALGLDFLPSRQSAGLRGAKTVAGSHRTCITFMQIGYRVIGCGGR